MAISGVNPKCYILALFVRDDGKRFLLGDDPYEFKDNQLHFQQNTMANDVVEVQGNDGYLLAGQVRRPGTQVFDGYVCNGTNSKEEVEVKRRSFLQFFRRSHFYKVIYVFPNGTAIQRKQGFLVDDPTVQELYQQYPEYHVALNFEDVNYYTYEEDDQGHEIYAKEAIVPLAGGGATGGLIWDNYGVVWEDPWSLPLSISGKQFQILNNAGAVAPIENTQLQGDIYQQTYTGRNLYQSIGATNNGITGTLKADGTLQISGTATSSSSNFTARMSISLPAGTYTFSLTKAAPFRMLMRSNLGQNHWVIEAGQTSATQTVSSGITELWVWGYNLTSGTSYNFDIGFQLEAGSSASLFEPYVGGIPAPNPDYPQTVQTVTGEQTVEVNGDGVSQDYEINLGKNLFDKDNPNLFIGYFDVGVQDPSLIYVSGNRNRVLWLGCKPNTTYSFSFENLDSFNPPQVGTTSELPADGIAVSKLGNFSSGSMKLENVTTTSDARYLVIRFQTSAGSININDVLPSALDGLQIEVSSTATPYAPYFTPIELCKIGDYQDYIYKDGDDWYVHKAIKKVNASTLPHWYYSNSTNFKTNNNGSGFNDYVYPASGNVVGTVLCESYTPDTTSRIYNGIPDYGVSLSPADKGICFRNKTITSLADWTTFLSQNTVYIYLALVTPTDTQITDATLVGQLEAMGAMKLFVGENNVLVGATGTNLPATLAFDYYTKFAAIGAEWEEGGTKGATIVDVDAIDNTYPVWELTGPATNPTLSVLTTNTALTYNGTITASQKLVIDMFNKTATLNGTSVIGNISGDFVYMAPGTNRVAYTAGNTDAPDSTIYWQEVVG